MTIHHWLNFQELVLLRCRSKWYFRWHIWWSQWRSRSRLPSSWMLPTGSGQVKKAHSFQSLIRLSWHINLSILLPQTTQAVRVPHISRMAILVVSLANQIGVIASTNNLPVNVEDDAERLTEKQFESFQHNMLSFWLSFQQEAKTPPDSSHCCVAHKPA